MYDLFLHNDNVYDVLWIDEKKYLVLKWSEVDFKKCQTTCSYNYIYIDFLFAFTEYQKRYLRLKGNLLFYFKDKDKSVVRIKYEIQTYMYIYQSKEITN